MKNFLLLFIAALSLLSLDALGDTTAVFSATAPTLYEDGDPIGLDDTLSYFLYCGTSSGDYTAALNVTADLVNGGETIDVGPCVSSPGTYYFVATAYSFLYKSESVYSNETSKLFIAADFDHIPMAPTFLSINP